jgi:hypothetical protein
MTGILIVVAAALATYGFLCGCQRLGSAMGRRWPSLDAIDGKTLQADDPPPHFGDSHEDGLPGKDAKTPCNENECDENPWDPRPSGPQNALQTQANSPRAPLWAKHVVTP